MTRDSLASTHRGYPLVLGVIRQRRGDEDGSVFAQLPQAQVPIDTEALEVRAIGPVDSWGGCGFHWGSAVRHESGPRTWQEASEHHCAAGIVLTGDQWVLFTDSLGIHPIYTREYEGSLYFANRLAPLLALPGPLHVDWSAWASTLVTGAPIGQATHFQEIRRLDAASGLAISAGKIDPVDYTPGWLSGPEQGPQVSSIVEAVRSGLPPRSLLSRPAAVTLSGGWDSRLLASLAAARYLRRPRAWTTSPDDGFDLDLEYAPAVAHALRLPHTLVLPGEESWPDDALETRSRVEYQTWYHTWLSPLGRRLRAREHAVLDGLAGDVLLKGLFVDKELLAAPEPQRLERLFLRLGGGADRILPLYRGAVGNAILETAFADFRAGAHHFAEHDNQLALTVLHTRTARTIGASPLLLFGPEVRPWLPFLHPDVLRHALAIPAGSKTGGKLYKQILGLAARDVADLPSTNDAPKDPSNRGPRRQDEPEAIAWLANTILASDAALRLVGDSLLSELRTNPTGWTEGRWDKSRFGQAVSLLSQWELTYRERLVNGDPPW